VDRVEAKRVALRVPEIDTSTVFDAPLLAAIGELERCSNGIVKA
jgi:hypothetical protein